MNHFGLSGIGIQVTGNPVVEPHAYGNQHIAFVGFDIGAYITMHSQHPFIQGMVSRHSRQSQ